MKINNKIIIFLAIVVMLPGILFSQAKNCDFWGTATYEGRSVGGGDVIKAYDPQGIDCGTAYYVSSGNYGIHVAGDDPSTPGDEGASGGDNITFKINGKTATIVGGSSTWNDNGSVQCNLNIPVSPPNSPSSLNATAVSQNQINLSWQDNSSNEDGFKIERKTWSGGTWSEITTTGANITTYSDNSLSSGTTYYYRVRAYNTGGNSGYSNEANATTFSAPAAPTGLSASSVSTSQINLNWTDNSSNEDGFKIERKTGSGGSWSEIATVGTNTTSYQNTGLPSGTNFYYRVYAYNGIGNSGYSNEANTWTGSYPQAPSNLTTTAVSTSQINLSWQDNAYDESGFKIERKTGSGGTYSEIATVGANTTNYQNTGLQSGTNYYYRVRAYNYWGDSGYSNESNTSTIADVNSPTGLNANGVSTSQIDLSWQDNSWNEDGFRIERKTWSGGSWAQVNTVSSNVTTYHDTGLLSSTTYYYRILAYNSATQSGYSNEANATTRGAPAAPTNLNATVVSPSQIDLSWQDNAINEDGFKIERKTGAGGVWTEIGIVSANITTYQNTNLSPGTLYYYQVRAYNTWGNSAYTGEIAATTGRIPANPSNLSATEMGVDQINLTWYDNSDNEDGFRIERKTGVGGSWSEIATVGPNISTYQSKSLTPNTTYFYQIRAYNIWGNSEYTNNASATTKAVSPPYLASCYPSNNSMGVPVNTPIQFLVKDQGFGIDMDRFSFNVNGSPIIINGQDQTGGNITITYHSPSFTVLYVPDSTFNEQSIVTVNVHCQDMADPVNSCDSSYTFSTGNSDVLCLSRGFFGPHGGSLEDPFTGVQIIMPPGALNDSTIIGVDITTNPPPLPDNLIYYAVAFHFYPDGIEFLQPVQIKIPYTQSHLINSGVNSPTELPVYFYSSLDGTWRRMSIDHADTEYLYILVTEFCYCVFIASSKTNIAENESIPSSYNLNQNYPNPFNPETRISFDLPEDAQVKCIVYNVFGEFICILLDEKMGAGEHYVTWNGRNQKGESVTSGVYFYVFEAGNYQSIKKMSLIK